MTRHLKKLHSWRWVSACLHVSPHSGHPQSPHTKLPVTFLPRNWCMCTVKIFYVSGKDMYEKIRSIFIEICIQNLESRYIPIVKYY